MEGVQANLTPGQVEPGEIREPTAPAAPVPRAQQGPSGVGPMQM